jgi:MGT family glycosyltransferase
MAKFLYVVLPALGHLNPTMPVASELKKRGHHVAYATGTDVKGPIENEGFQYFKVGAPGMSQINKNMQKALKVKGLLSNYFFFKVLMEHNRQSVEDLKLIVKDYRPDVIVADTLTFSGAEIAEHYNLPWAACSAVPGMIPSKDVPPYTHWGFSPSNNFLIRFFYNIIRFGQNAFFRFFDKEFNPIRKELGLAPLKCALINTTLSPYLILIASSEGFEYKRNDWPPQAHLIGPAPWGKVIDSSIFDWIDELPQDRPVIYITMGTFQAYRSTNFFDLAIEAFREEPYHIVLCISNAVDINDFKDPPSNFRIEQFVPNAKMLPRASAVVHHGGFGIAQDTIYNGLPAVVIPVAQDLYENARRCTEAGVAVKLKFSKLTPERLRNAVRRILEDDEIISNTKKLQEKFLSTDAGRTGADLLEKLAETKRPVYHT